MLLFHTDEFNFCHSSTAWSFRLLASLAGFSPSWTVTMNINATWDWARLTANKCIMDDDGTWRHLCFCDYARWISVIIWRWWWIRPVVLGHGSPQCIIGYWHSTYFRLLDQEDTTPTTGPRGNHGHSPTLHHCPLVLRLPPTFRPHGRFISEGTVRLQLATSLYI